jgi:hypothetical protein
LTHWKGHFRGLLVGRGFARQGVHPRSVMDSETIERRRLVALWAPLLICATATYVGTAARLVGGGDNGEFATMLAEGGVAHPPGYPLYVLYLRAMSWLPASSPAHAASVATALLGGGAVLGLLLACTSWGASVPAAAIAGAVFAFSPLAWRAATEPEVFALNALIGASILALTGPACRLGVRKRLCLLGLFAGLGLANHHSIVLLAPAVLWAIVRFLRSREARASDLSLFAAAAAAGLLAYVHSWHTATHAAGRWIWGDPGSPVGLWHHFVRGDYGTTRLSLSGAEPSPAIHLGLLATRMASDLWIVPPVAAIAGIAWLLVRRSAPSPAASRADGGALFLTLLTAGPVFVSRFNIDPTGIGALVVERFYLLPETLLCVPMALGVDLAARSLRGRTGAKSTGVPPWLAILAMIGAAAAGGVFSWPDVRERHRPTVEIYARNTLESTPKDAVILGTGDHRLYGFLYAQRALGIRPDVVYLDPNMWRYEWYRRRLAPAFGRPLYEPVGSSVATIALAESLLATGRPLFVANLFNTAIVRALPSYPFGTLIRILPRAATAPPPEAVEQKNLLLDARFQHEDSPPIRAGTWAGDVQEAYSRPWFALADAFTARGQAARASANRERGRAAARWVVAEP